MSSYFSLVSEIEFVLATRDTGYRSTANAVAELVDNALQAEASQVRIRVAEERTEDGRQITLSVLDNGHGMSPQIMRKALQFGGTDRFNDRSGLGRYGMGLPNSSVSQCRRVELYSWQNQQNVRWTYLDVDEIAARTLQQIPSPQQRELPEWAHSTTQTGTFVVWKRCDRLDYRKANTIASKLCYVLGRKFRHFLFAGQEIIVNGEAITPIDPLFVHEASPLSGAEEPFPPLQYPVRTNDGSKGESIIEVRFSILPVSSWHNLPVDEKRFYGISGGAGVSVVRGGREIAYGWYFMGKKRRQNYDDWWRCEVVFEPELDEWFGVTHSKQGISPVEELNAFIAPDMAKIAHRLNTRVQTEFAKVREPERARSIINAERRDWMLPQLPQLIQRYEERELKQLSRRREGLQYRIEVCATADPNFFSWALRDDMLLVQINKNHPFYLSVYQPAADSGDTGILFHLECLLLAFARSEARRTGRAISSESTITIREDWSHVLAALLG